MKFKVIVSTALILIVLLQASVVGMLAYAGHRAQTTANSAQKTLSDKTIILDKDTNQINKSLQTADTSLQQINKQLQQSPYSKQLTQLPTQIP